MFYGIIGEPLANIQKVLINKVRPFALVRFVNALHKRHLSFPKDICKKIFSKGISISAVGQNILLWSKQFKYSDPDGGYDNFSDPSIRYVGFNVKVGF